MIVTCSKMIVICSKTIVKCCKMIVTCCKIIVTCCKMIAPLNFYFKLPQNLFKVKIAVFCQITKFVGQTK